jgi:hypothetical protein
MPAQVVDIVYRVSNKKCSDRAQEKVTGHFRNEISKEETNIGVRSELVETGNVDDNELDGEGRDACCESGRSENGELSGRRILFSLINAGLVG